jgi:hypothetical protein
MYRLHCCLGVACVLAAAAANLRAEDKDKAKDNSPPEGFKLLFNGKDLAGWQGLVDVKKRSQLSPEDLAKAQKEADKELTHWKVEDGALHFDGKGQNLVTAKDYGNFELFVDWKIKEKGDSGIYLRGNPQVQIWDSDHLADNLKEDWHTGSGGLWNNPKGSKGKQPLKKADKPVGEWNTFHIIMKGDKVTVVLNGEKVVDDVPLANYWDKGKPLPAKGPIELQNHGDELWFKNIYIKELPD